MPALSVRWRVVARRTALGLEYYLGDLYAQLRVQAVRKAREQWPGYVRYRLVRAGAFRKYCVACGALRVRRRAAR